MNTIAELIENYFEFIASNKILCVVGKNERIYQVPIVPSIISEDGTCDLDQLFNYISTELKYCDIEYKETMELLSLIEEIIKLIPLVPKESLVFEIGICYPKQDKETEYVSTDSGHCILDICGFYKKGTRLIGYTGSYLG